MIVATAGHIDHGKTSLVKQLTGVDTDRLEEEKRRGLSINLGFAYRRLTDDPETNSDMAVDPDDPPLCATPTLGFIDVPGHKRFINTMIAGVSSIDLGMLIVAADDGPMPQTVEHLDVMRLLEVEDYVLVVTKIDKVDSQRVATVRESVLELMGKSSARLARSFEVSNINGEGITELRQYLDQRALSHQARISNGIFRLSVDRAFTLKGLGLVVTGTVTAGEISIGDSVQILPRGATLRVRNVHAQDQTVQRGQAGQRCALNIVGDIEKSDIERGDWLVGLGSAGVSERFAARCRLLDDAPVSLKHMAPVKLYIGAKKIAARIYFLENKNGNNLMRPGDSRLVQLIVDSSISCCRGERFLLRDDSESFTLGGGMVLDAKARRVRKVQAEHLNLLTALELPHFVAGLRQLVLKQQQIIDFDAFRQNWNIHEAQAEEALQAAGLLEQIKLCKTDQTRFAVANDRWLSMGQGTVGFVNDWHVTHPAEAGITPGELEKQLGKLIDHRLFTALLDALASEGRLSLVGGLVSCEGVKHWQRVQDFLQSRGLKLPKLAELETESGLKSAEITNAVRAAVEEGRLHKINEKRIGLASTLRDLANDVRILAQSQSTFSAVDYRKQTGVGRRLAVEVLEYFDSIGFTQRNGNERIVVNDEIPDQFFGS